jgi:hypothetical protein
LLWLGVEADGGDAEKLRKKKTPLSRRGKAERGSEGLGEGDIPSTLKIM